MNRRILGLLGASLGLAFAATFGVYRLSVPAGGESSAPAMRRIVVVAAPVPAGAPLAASALRVADWPAAAVPPTAFPSVEAVVGRVALTTLAAGTPLLATQLAPRGAAAGLEVAIGSGLRAMAVRVSEALGTSGLLHADSRVDVLVTLRDEDAGTRPRARLLMSDVRVLAVGAPHARTVGDEPPPPPTAAEASIVTLEVTPEQAEQLAVVESQGSIQLVLRGFGSRDRAVTAGTTMRDVLGLPALAAGMASDLTAGARAVESAAPAPRAATRVTPEAGEASTQVDRVRVRPRPDTMTVRVYRGDKLTIERFEASPRPSRREMAEGETRTP